MTITNILMTIIIDLMAIKISLMTINAWFSFPSVKCKQLVTTGVGLAGLDLFAHLFLDIAVRVGGAYRGIADGLETEFRRRDPLLYGV